MLGIREILRSWKDLSIAKRLYVVVGVMATLIAIELMTLRFAMHTLSAVRAFVVGESHWSKAQKNAVYRLERYARSRDESDYRAFLEHLKIPEGDRRARIELAKEDRDFRVVTQGFLEGQLHVDDIPRIIDLLDRFQWVSYIQRALTVRAEGDALVAELKVLGENFHHELNQAKPDAALIHATAGRVREVNMRLTEVEAEFANALGEGSRWMENVLIVVLFIAVLFVEAIGLTLTIRTVRQISRGLGELGVTAEAIGRGEFSRRAAVDSRDEIGILGTSVNNMGAMLQQSYSDLEERVRARTFDLEKALRIRDDFVSVISHELNTPLASLRLQFQLRRRLLDKGDESGLTVEKLKKTIESDDRQLDRLIRLVQEMLDHSRLSRGRFSLERESTDLAALVDEVIERFSGNLVSGGYQTQINLATGVVGNWDPYRLEQVITNLFTNAMKYGEGKPIRVGVSRVGTKARLEIQDGGRGIAPADQTRIFDQFERAVPGTHISGLGLGLYIVREIVAAHGGGVSVESALGHGATFIVELPMDV